MRVLATIMMQIHNCQSWSSDRNPQGGCYIDSENRDLPHLRQAIPEYWKFGSIAWCMDYCKKRGNAYAAVQYEFQCFCGDSFGKHGKGGGCNKRCKDSTGLNCGGSWRQNVYATNIQPWAFGNPQGKCFIDGVDRDLPNFLGRVPNSWVDTLDWCDGECKKGGYRFFGLQNARECWCGNSFGSYGEAKSWECRMRCPDGSGNRCGGKMRLNVHSVKGIGRFNPTDKIEEGDYFLFNKKYPLNKIKQKNAGTNGNVDTVTDATHDLAQMWSIRKDPNTEKGYFIWNNQYANHRLTLHKNMKMGTWSGHVYDDQVWYFEKSSDGYYYIVNKRHPDQKLVIRPNRSFNTYDGPAYTDQEWKLVPRFSTTLEREVVFTHCNQKPIGTKPDEKTFKETIGIKKASTTGWSSTTTLADSVSNSLSSTLNAGFELEGLTAGMSTTATTEEIKSVERAMAVSGDITTAVHRTREYTLKSFVPPKSTVIVYRVKAMFTSPLNTDNFVLLPQQTFTIHIPTDKC